jgi:hypothetical protein
MIRLTENDIRHIVKNVLLETLDISGLHGKTFISYGTNKYDPTCIKPINVNSEWGKVNNKPHGGLWASTIDSSFSWGDFCDREAFNLKSLNKHFIFKLKPKSKICVIDNIDDLIFYSVFDDYIEKYTLDFKKIVKEFDGLYATDCVHTDISNIVHAKYNKERGENYVVLKEETSE